MLLGLESVVALFVPEEMIPEFDTNILKRRSMGTYAGKLRVHCGKRRGKQSVGQLKQHPEKI